VNTVRALGLESQAGQIIATIQSSGHTGEIDFHAFLEIFALTSESNAEASLQLVFEEFDKKATGGFDAVDFERVAGSVGEHFSAAEVDQIIDYADKDRDGVISYEEFLHVVTKVYPKV
jgi:Ca2+-binding EF-hand superfamily protein